MAPSFDDMQDVSFRSCAVGRRGYRKDEVDAFLRRLQDTFRSYQGSARPSDPVTPVDIHHAAFGRASLVDRGYDAADVDDFLDRAEEMLATLCQEVEPVLGGQSDQKLPLLPEGGLLAATDLADTSPAKAPLGKRGYHEKEVDRFLGRIEATLRGEDHLSAGTVHSVAFSRSPRGRRGYDERTVDVLLDRAEETLRWREKALGTLNYGSKAS